jgi:hypothetical protein
MLVTVNINILFSLPLSTVIDITYIAIVIITKVWNIYVIWVFYIISIIIKLFIINYLFIDNLLKI